MYSCPAARHDILHVSVEVSTSAAAVPAKQNLKGTNGPWGPMNLTQGGRRPAHRATARTEYGPGARRLRGAGEAEHGQGGVAVELCDGENRGERVARGRSSSGGCQSAPVSAPVADTRAPARRVARIPSSFAVVRRERTDAPSVGMLVGGARTRRYVQRRHRCGDPCGARRTV